MEKCKGNLNNFCYVCGIFTPIDERKKSNKKFRSITDEFKKIYNVYFNQTVIEDVDWVPKLVCKTCYTGLFKWIKREQQQMPFGSPMIWTNPGAHTPTNCYACVNTVKGMNSKKAKTHQYKEVQSAQRPLPHDPISRPVPPYPSPDRLTSITTTTTPAEETPNYSYFDPGPLNSNEPVLITQERLNYIVSKLELSQRKSEI